MEASLYIHIPFCKKKCHYCDFCSSTDSLLMATYVEHLKVEESLLRVTYPQIIAYKSVFVGGGTPTALPDTTFKALMDFISALPRTANCEWTVEANPESLTPNKLNFLKNAGCNRLSIGLQDTDEFVLKSLGRIHSKERFFDAYRDARRSGFKNINIDLMFGVPGQTVHTFRKTLAEVTALKPEHISAYSLKIEEGTVFHHRVKAGELEPLSEKTDRELYHLIKETLTSWGYQQYELSNFALNHFQCAHNLSYWHNENFVALGVSSAYYMNQVRYTNTVDISQYLSKLDLGLLPIETAETNTIEIERFETLFLQLRLMDGLAVDAFEARYGIDFNCVYGPAIDGLIDRGLIKRKGNQILLTDLGQDLSNQVFLALMVDY